MSADTGNSQQIAEGKALFAVGCASCHGLNGEGQVTGAIQGPPLAGVGAAAVDFQVSYRADADGQARTAGAGQAQHLHRGRDRSPRGVRRHASARARLSPTRPIRHRNLSEEDLARGGELFRTNCSACHNFEGAGGALPNGKYAPPLIGLDNKRIYEAMLTGPQQMPVFYDEVLRPEDKRAIIGYLESCTSAQPTVASPSAASAR